MGFLQEGDALLLRDNELEPEVMFIAVAGINVATDEVTVEQRGDAGTKAYAHGAGATVERVIYFWEVLGMQPPASDDMRIRLKLLEIPLNYGIRLHVAPETLTGTFDTWTPVEQRRYGGIAQNSGYMSDRDVTTKLILAEG